MPSQFKQDNPGCDCCGLDCDDADLCECIYDGAVQDFPAFQIQMRSFDHFSGPPCDICDTSGLNDTWWQYDPCTDGATVDQPTAASTLGGGWYKVFEFSGFDSCLGSNYDVKIFVRLVRVSSTLFNIQVMMEDYDSAFNYGLWTLPLTVVGCQCPDFTDTDEIQIGGGGGVGQTISLQGSGEVWFQWL